MRLLRSGSSIVDEGLGASVNYFFVFRVSTRMAFGLKYSVQKL